MQNHLLLVNDFVWYDCFTVVIRMNLPESLKLLSDTLWKIKEKEVLKLWLEDLLTPSELVEIAERINIIRSLKDWKTQRVIADDLGISVTTVSRGSRVLKYGKGVIENYV